MFCTGGIRCEKASAVMMQQGWSDVETIGWRYPRLLRRSRGGEHWNGDCFVFDRRVALDPALEGTTTQVCWACGEPLTEEEMESEQYVLANLVLIVLRKTRISSGKSIGVNRCPGLVASAIRILNRIFPISK